MVMVSSHNNRNPKTDFQRSTKFLLLIVNLFSSYKKTEKNVNFCVLPQLMEKIFDMPQPPDESYVFGLWLKLKVKACFVLKDAIKVTS